jgi:hypothetical protein
MQEQQQNPEGHIDDTVQKPSNQLYASEHDKMEPVICNFCYQPHHVQISLNYTFISIFMAL